MAVKSLRSISYSEVAAALKCPASWDFSYGDTLAGASLKPRSTAAILSNGSAWGAAVAEWHSTGDLFAALGAAEDSFAADRRNMVERGILPDLGETLRQGELVGRCLEHYVEDSVRMENFGQIEREIELPIPARTPRGWVAGEAYGGYRNSSKYRYLAKLDGHATYRDHPAIAEFKFRGQLTELAVVELQPQYRWYAWAYAREIGWDGPVSVLVDERLSVAPNEARLVKAAAKDSMCPVCHEPPGMPCAAISGDDLLRRGSFHAQRKELVTVSSAVDQVTTVGLYERACFDNRAFVDNNVLAALRSREWGKRHVLTFTPSQLAEAGLELTSAARKVASLDRGDEYPIRNGSVQNCRGCRFKEICSDPRNTFVVDSIFERRPAKRNREEAAQC